MLNAKNGNGTTDWSIDQTFITTNINAVNEKNINILALNVYPNPCNKVINIDFTIPGISNVSLKIYNNLGENIGTILEKYLEAGSYNVNWDAINLPTGVYYLRLSTLAESKILTVVIIQ